MNVDTQFPPAPLATLPGRPSQAKADQASARPVDRPHHIEPGNNQDRQNGGQIEARKETERPSNEARVARQESELNGEERRELDKLKARDREVRAHEAAHQAAAGSLVRGGAQFEFQTGPDGRRYAVGGEVNIDTAEVPGDPQATLHKAQTIQRAANAPAEPSAQDRAVAAEAGRMEVEARQELSEQAAEERDAAHTAPPAQETGARLNRLTEAAPVGELLDVLA